MNAVKKRPACGPAFLIAFFRFYNILKERKEVRTMRMTDILEKDREKLLTDLSGGKTPAEAVQIITGELERLLITYNSGETVPEKGEEASRMMEAVKAAVCVLTGIGDVKLWERETETKKPEKKKMSAVFWILLLLSMLFLGGTVALLVLSSAGKRLSETFSVSESLGYVIPAAAVFLSFLTGLRLGLGNKGEAPKKERKLEVIADGEKIFRILHATALTIDRELENITPSKSGKTEEERKEVTEEELELYGSIFEAGTADPAGMLSECVENLRYFLHKKGIETVDYTEEHDMWFEKMPGKESITVRPALLKDGELLRRGMAVI